MAATTARTVSRPSRTAGTTYRSGGSRTAIPAGSAAPARPARGALRVKAIQSGGDESSGSPRGSRMSASATAMGETFSFARNRHIDQPPSDDPFYSAPSAASSVLPRRKTKMVCTIGPATWDRRTLFKLADEGMNVARLNMSHGDHASHGAVIDLIREYNKLGRGNIGILLDTKGPEVRSGDLKEPLMLVKGEKYRFTIKSGAPKDDGGPFRIGVNYDGFIDDVSVGDVILVDGGIQSFQVLSKTDSDVEVEVIDGGEFKSRRHLNIRGKSANLPAITDRDWEDLKFGVERDVDYIALSFVRDAQVIYDLKSYLTEHSASIGVLAKIESADSVMNLEEIMDAVDGCMVARGDLGAELPVEEVPYWQNRIVQGCRKRGKPVIVATNMLESMIENATPTRAEVSDIAIAVREGTDATMLSGESAYGKFPFKAVDVMSTVATHTERSMLSYSGSRRHGTHSADKIDWITPPQWRGSTELGISDMFAYHASIMANTLKTSLVVFTRKGNMPALLSHYRPDNTIYAITNSQKVQRLLSLYHGVEAIYMEFLPEAEDTFEEAMLMLKDRGYVSPGQLLALVQSGRTPIWRSTSTHNIQVRPVPMNTVAGDDDSDELLGLGRPRSRAASTGGSSGNALPGM